MARLRTETAPEITVNDESVVFKAASGATAPLVEFKNSAGTVVGNIAANGVMNVTSVFASNAGSGSTALATRGYVDDLFAGVSWQNPVALATTAALPSCTYNNGTAGVGATLTATANGVLTVDLGTAEAGYSILVKNQATATQNGIYTVTTAGAVGTPFVLTRRTDSDNNPAGEVTKGDAVFVVAGSANINCGFILTGTPSGANNAIVFGTDNLTYSQFTGTGGFTAGDGLVVTNNTVNVVSASSGRLVVNADNIDLATVSQTNTSGANTTSFISGHTVDAYGRVTSTTTSSVSFAGYATLASPALTGVPLSPTAATNTNNTQIASTEFVINQIENNAVVKALANAKGDIFTATSDNTPAVLSVGTNGYFLRANSGATNGIDWGVPASAIDDITDVTITSVANGDLLKWNGTAWVNAAGYALLASPTFSGTPTLPTGTIATTQTAADSTTAVATTAFVTTADNLKANIASPTFTGTVSGITATMVGLGSVNNTADTAKPVSTAQQTALDLKANIASPTFTGTVTIPSGASISGFAPLASPALTGTPTAPTAAAATNTTQIATTAFVRGEVTALVNGATATLDTLGEIATALGNDANLSTTLTTSIGLKAPLASPTFTGTVTIPSGASISGFAPLASPTFTGTVTLPTGTVTSAMILDGTIANADISASAAIDQGKIADTVLNAQTASYTLALTDKNKLVEISNASANTLTVPPNSSVAFPVGSTLTVLQTGAGQCTITAGSGVTVNGTPGLKLRTTWSSATLIKRATDTWVALGDMVA